MRQKLSDDEFHALYCPVKSAKSALFLVASFSLVAFVAWKGLHKPFEPPDVVELFFVVIVGAILAKWLVAFTCFRDRLVIGIVIVNLLTGEVTRFLPSVFGQYAEIIKSGKLALWLLGLLVSATMLVQSFRTARIKPSAV
jgi:hypothetical protein